MGDDWIDAPSAIALLPRFEIQLDQPSYLANRWLTAIVRLYSDEITHLVRDRDKAIDEWDSQSDVAVREDRGLEVTAELRIELSETAKALGLSESGSLADP